MPEEAQAAIDGAGQAPELTEATDAGSEGEQTVQTVDGLPDWAQSLIGDLRKENAGHRKAKKEAETAAQKAEDERLAKQQEWKQLAEKHQARLSELEPLSEQVKSYKSAVQKMVDKQLEAVPDHIKELLADRDPVWQLNYLTEHADELRPQGPPNINATTTNAQTQKREPTDAEVQEFAARTGVNPAFVDKSLIPIN